MLHHCDRQMVDPSDKSGLKWRKYKLASQADAGVPFDYLNLSLPIFVSVSSLVFLGRIRIRFLVETGFSLYKIPHFGFHQDHWSLSCHMRVLVKMDTSFPRIILHKAKELLPYYSHYFAKFMPRSICIYLQQIHCGSRLLKCNFLAAESLWITSNEVGLLSLPNEENFYINTMLYRCWGILDLDREVWG